MESLKAFSEITEPDGRQELFRVFNKRTRQHRARTLGDVYTEAESIKLNASVPDEVRSHFATALNLLVYAWYFYPFNVTAQLMGYTTIEKALKLKYPDAPDAKRRQNFQDLVRRAAKDRLIQESSFSHLQPDPDDPLRQSLDMGFQGERESYAEVLIKVLPSMRNSLAHGSSMLHPNGASQVLFCAEFINQLFPAPVVKDDADYQ